MSVTAGSSSHESISPDAEPTEDGHINQLSKVMFEKIADYLQGELSG